ncbi:AAA family ATPase [Bacillus cereus group sp. BfR-BA-01329]|uniref:AAA family ATPase n=1 Tax=Bacillus cereus group sp. BfR-BA-01329 TaxID=2920305 RepID=UPI001F597935|nr:AAA family ATPase [Bacillus cereus group sp. BfR-BA-01329]
MSIKLKSLYIQNFRNIKTTYLEDMNDVNLFIGKNNIGKSNYLRATRCFLEAIGSQSLYTKGILDKEDIMNNTDANELALMGVLEVSDQYYIACVGCTQKKKEIYTYHLIMKISDKAYGNFQELMVHYKREQESYSGLVEMFLDNIEQVKDFNAASEQYKKDYEYVSSLTIDLKIEETINAHKYIEDNLNLSDSAMLLLETNAIDMQDIKTDILLKLKREISSYDRYVQELIKGLKEVEKVIKDMWEINLGESKVNSIRFQNENITISQEIIKNNKIMFQPEKKEGVTSEDAHRLFSLKNRKENFDVWMNFRNMCKRMLGIEIDVFFNQENQPVIDVGDNLINLNGTGIREIFRIILDIELLRPEIILIEEPEIHLHFELQQRLSEYLQLKAKYAQVFITSHSTAFVEETYDKSVYLIKRKEEEENSIQLLDSESLDQVISELGYNAQALLIKKMLIFVEGKTDKLIVDTYLQKFHPQMLSKIGCIDMKGETKYKYFANAESLEIFEKSGVETFFILDSDYKTPDEKERKISQHPERSSLVFWPGVCIENLFLSPVILDKFIKAKDGTKMMDVDEVGRIMKKTYTDIKIESSRKYIREKYLTAIYPEKNSKDAVHDIEGLKEWFNKKRAKMREQLDLEIDIDKVMKEFNTLWEKKLDEVVPGDKFLAKFCENVGDIAYKKNEKNVRYLINDLSQEEWPTDFMKIMDEIIRKANN